MAKPAVVEVYRGDLVESRHLVSAVVCDSDGEIVASAGDVESLIYPRSSLKAIQAVPLFLSGAVERYQLNSEDLALACSSHNGEWVHVTGVRSMLRKAGLSQDYLQCGPQWPRTDEDRARLTLDNQSPKPIHNNCSGKHAGFLCAAMASNLSTDGYLDPDHGVQVQVRDVIKQFSQWEADEEVPWSIDGCSAPTAVMPLKILAQSFARWITGKDIPEEFAYAAKELHKAVVSQPLMVAGSGSFDTEALSFLGHRAYLKCGAEGVYAGGISENGFGFALKCHDGSTRGAEVAAAALIAQFVPMTSGEQSRFQVFTNRSINTRNNEPVGSIKPLLKSARKSKNNFI